MKSNIGRIEREEYRERENNDDNDNYNYNDKSINNFNVDDDHRKKRNII